VLFQLPHRTKTYLLHSQATNRCPPEATIKTCPEHGTHVMCAGYYALDNLDPTVQVIVNMPVIDNTRASPDDQPYKIAYAAVDFNGTPQLFCCMHLDLCERLLTTSQLHKKNSKPPRSRCNL
jgi:hypothetical protein